MVNFMIGRLNQISYFLTIQTLNLSIIIKVNVTSNFKVNLTQRQFQPSCKFILPTTDG